MKIIKHKGRFIGFSKRFPPIIGLSQSDIEYSYTINLLTYGV